MLINFYEYNMNFNVTEHTHIPIFLTAISPKDKENEMAIGRLCPT